MDYIQQPDFKYKILIIGDTSAGKTSILLQYTQEKFTSHYIMTIGKMTFVLVDSLFCHQ